jgi:phosphoglycerate dehydrogenase-like enzyme
MIAAVADNALTQARALAPGGVEIRRLAGGDLDGVSFIVAAWDGGPVADLSGLRALRAVQTLSAGTDWIEDVVPAWATLCNARGARDGAVAEWVVGALLGASTGLLTAARRRAWRHERPRELAGSTVLIVGHGSIGRAVAERIEPMGARVVGVARRARDGVHGVEELPQLLPHADAVVMLAPLTGETAGMADADFLARMRDGALLLNAGRGATVVTRALVDELASGRLRAVLDVVDPEPLPDDHPLWRAEGLLALTAHQSGDSVEADERAATLAAEQLARFARGEPLRNVVRAATAPPAR